MSETGQNTIEPNPLALRFDRYVLDLHRGCLLLKGEEIELRPKTYAVLVHLVRNAQRLVGKDELFAAVWPNLSVTDDALVQSIGELRRALGDDGLRLVKTIPRRGYRFEASVAPATTTSTAPASSAWPFAKASGKRLRMFAGLALAAVCAVALLAIFATRNLSPGTFAHRQQQVRARPTIAVLPFASQTAEAALDPLTDGLTQDIIAALGRFHELTVMSWNAVLPYKGRVVAPADIADSLAVQYLVEGDVRPSATGLRATARLTDPKGLLLWSGQFEGASAERFAVQDKIVTQLAGALAVGVGRVEERRVRSRPPESLEAYELVVRASSASQRPTRANNAEARTLLRRAIELDPKYAAAHSAMAETYYVAQSMGWAEQPAAFLDRAESLASHAIGLDDTEVRARVVLGRVHLTRQRYEQASTQLLRARDINPNDAQALAAHGNVLMWLGQTEAAIEALELAQRIDPELNAIDRFALSLAYYLRGRYGAAIELAERSLEKTASAHFSRAVLAAAYAQQNRVDDAARAIYALREQDPTFDPNAFGNKLLGQADLAHLRDGFRKAGLLVKDDPPSRPE